MAALNKRWLPFFPLKQKKQDFFQRENLRYNKIYSEFPRKGTLLSQISSYFIHVMDNNIKQSIKYYNIKCFNIELYYKVRKRHYRQF